MEEKKITVTVWVLSKNQSNQSNEVSFQDQMERFAEFVSNQVNQLVRQGLDIVVTGALWPENPKDRLPPIYDSDLTLVIDDGRHSSPAWLIIMEPKTEPDFMPIHVDYAQDQQEANGIIEIVIENQLADFFHKR